MLTDVIILALPIPTLWNLQLPRVSKVALISALGVGSL